MIDRAFALITAAIGLLMFLWPAALVRSLDSPDLASRVAKKRAIGLLAFVMGLIMFTAR